MMNRLTPPATVIFIAEKHAAGKSIHQRRAGKSTHFDLQSICLKWWNPMFVGSQNDISSWFIHPTSKVAKTTRLHLPSNIQLERTSQCVYSQTSLKLVISSPCLAASLEMLHPARSAASEIFHVWYWGTLQFMAHKKNISQFSLLVPHVWNNNPI